MMKSNAQELKIRSDGESRITRSPYTEERPEKKRSGVTAKKK